MVARAPLRGADDRRAPLRTYLTAVEPIPVGHDLPAAATAAWLHWALGDDDVGERNHRRLQWLSSVAGIEHRATCVEDHTHTDPERLTLYTRDRRGALTASLDDRMARFECTSGDIARRALAPLETAPDHLLQVSCTGYSAPSAVQLAAAERGWHRDTRILSLGHIGCHAAVPALTHASHAIAATARRRDRPSAAAVVHIELCTLHLRADPTARDWFTHAALFADGAARVGLSTQAPAVGFELLDEFELMVADSSTAMTWRLANDGFRMHLGTEVPRIIGQELRSRVTEFLHGNELDLDDIDCFAIHPGGPRVLDGCARALELDPHRHRHATEVLRRSGNMSSATLPHIWASMLRDCALADGALVCSLAFGPGITLTGNLLRVIR